QRGGRGRCRGGTAGGRGDGPERHGALVLAGASGRCGGPGSTGRRGCPRGRVGRRAVRVGRGRERGPGVGAPGDPAVLPAAEARLAGAVGAPRGGGLGTAAVLGLGRGRRGGGRGRRDGGGGRRGRRGGGGRFLDRVLVEEVRAGLLHGGLRRCRAGRRRETLTGRGRRTARAGHPGGTVPVPDVSRNGRVRVIPFAGPVVARGRGWGAHVRRPVSARWGGSGGYTSIRPPRDPRPVPPDRPLSGGDVVRPEKPEKLPATRVMLAAPAALSSYGPSYGPCHERGAHAMNTVVERELELRLILSPERALPVPARLVYRADDPYAVHVAFHVTSEQPVHWTFARELLVEGVFRPCGYGDVRVWPSKADGRSLVLMALSSPDGDALLEAPAA